MDNLRFFGYLFGQPVIVDDEVSFEQRMGTMALDMVGQITGIDLYLVERQGRMAVERTAQNYEAVIDKWEAHSNDLKRKLNIEKCHSAGQAAQYNLLKKYVDENRPRDYLNKSGMVHAETGTQLSKSQLVYCLAYNAKAAALKVPAIPLKALGM